ncbi:hypothetical protein [Asticcacaulis machinosus]|uniref:Uncharacterized protein n=1 Tax=Asticcacaulis machinosus TaxID=2984211 RepID=A0ABT5HGN8_9CAUL|nr:hypothetical protein [Asticcacaulis machinosus]MDC7675397.1 hypothetical protein [Asticcacaulis machinosus]
MSIVIGFDPARANSDVSGIVCMRRDHDGRLRLIRAKTAQVMEFKPRPVIITRRAHIRAKLTTAAMSCASDTMTAVWLKKANQAGYLPSAELTAQPETVITDFTPDGFDPRDKGQVWPWLSIVLLTMLAIALTPMGWLL